MLDYLHQDQWPDNFGRQQSPISISDSVPQLTLESINLALTAPYYLNEEVDDETTIRLLGTGQAIILGRTFDFQQVHFHAPAEHIINGQQAPFEIHLVHQNTIGQLHVVALLVRIGDADPTLQQIFDHFEAGTSQDVFVEMGDWLPASPTGYHYLGSLTTPPLTEGVEWTIITNPNVTISQSQLNWFKTHFKPNNRQPQALNQRVIESFRA